MLILSCSERLEPTPQTYSQLLSGTESKTWRLTTIQLIEGKTAPFTFQLPQCITDDQYVFYAGDIKLFQVLEGPSKCDPEEEDFFLEDTWSLVNATATLHMVFPLLSDARLPFIIKSLTESSLVIEIYFDEDEDGSSSYRMTFISQRT
ncbi:MAG: hypothetical protein M3421_10585 [Bacteroidota bacterium]|nr:hypothetical protein [Bacteroidota bacterium]